jgi:hypothetical protein
MNPGFMAMMAKKKAGAKEPKKMNMGGMGGMGYAKGGSASSRADGVATKGKTKGTDDFHENGRQSLLNHDGQPWYGGHRPL